MQSVAVIADIHANLPALESVLEEIDGLGIEHILCCGDIVGYAVIACAGSRGSTVSSLIY